MCTINETESTEALWLISSHNGWFGKDHLVLHSEPSEKASPLASVRFSTTSNRIDIRIPSLDDGANKTAIHMTQTIEPNTTPQFSFDTGTEKGETLIWRYKLSGIQEMLPDARGEEQGHDGWVLSRRRAGTGCDDGSEEENVAVWAPAGCRKPKVGGKMATARLMGCARDGSIGNHGVLSVVMSLLAVFERDRRIRESRSATFSTHRPRKGATLLGGSTPGVMNGTI